MKKFLALIFASGFLAACGNTQTPVSVETPTTQMPSVSDISYESLLANASKKIVATTEFNACITPKIQSCINETAQDIATKTKNTDFCRELGDEDSKNSCMFGVVMSTIHEDKDASKCDILEDESLKNACKNAVITEQAQSENNVEKCREIDGATPERIDSCMLNTILSSEKAEPKDCEVLQEMNKTICQNMLEGRKEMQKSMDDMINSHF